MTNAADDRGRALSELELPFVRDALVYDELTTSNVIQLQGDVICNSGDDYPYSTTTAARTAFNAILPDAEITTCTLQSGTYDGSFSPNASLGCWNLPDSGLALFLKAANLAESPTEKDVLKLTLSVTQGA